jgi:hypothetical protein
MTEILEEALRKQEEELIERKQILEGQAQRLQQAEGEKAAVEARNRELEERVNDQRQQLDDRAKQAKQLQEEVNGLTNQMQEREAAHGEAIQQLERANNQLEERNRQLNEQVNLQQQQLQDQTLQIQNLEAQQNQAREENVGLERRNGELNRERENLHGLVWELQRRLAIQPGSSESEATRWTMKPETLIVNRDDPNALLGGGGNGAVYRGTWYGWPVAAKILFQVAFPEVYRIPPGSEHYQQMVREFDEEVKVLLQVRHPHLILFLGVTYGELGGHRTPQYLVTERATRSLNDVLKATPGVGLPVDRLVRYCKPVLQAIHHLHRNNIIHRDIKPDNILVFDPQSPGEEEIVKICDVGVAKILAAGTTEARSIIGTAIYAAPEMLKGLSYSFGVDLFSFGVTLAEMIDGWRDRQPPPRCAPFPFPASHSLYPLVISTTQEDPVNRFNVVQALDFLDVHFP